MHRDREEKLLEDRDFVISRRCSNNFWKTVLFLYTTKV